MVMAWDKQGSKFKVTSGVENGTWKEAAFKEKGSVEQKIRPWVETWMGVLTLGTGRTWSDNWGED